MGLSWILLAIIATGGGKPADGDSSFDLPLAFVKNRGQWIDDVLFKGQLGGGEVVVQRDGFAIETQDGGLRLRFRGTSAKEVVGIEPLGARSHFFYGGETTTDVPNFSRVLYRHIRAGVDVVLFGHRGGIRYDLHLAPGATLDDVEIEVEGATLRGDGELSLSAPWGICSQSAPRAWEIAHDVETPVDVRIIHVGEGLFGFLVPERRLDRRLVIDPTIHLPSSRPRSPSNDPTVSLSTYIGGVASDVTWGMDVVSSSGVYIIGGSTFSKDFPTSEGAYDRSYNGTSGGHAGDLFVVGLDPSRSGGEQLLFSTYVGSADQEHVQDLVVDDEGNILICGVTSSFDGFPTTPGAYASSNRRDGDERTGPEFFDPILVKLSGDGSQLLYSSLIGSDMFDHPLGMALAGDGSGDIVVTGETYRSSSEPPLDFPTTPGAFQSEPDRGVGNDVFVLRFRLDDSIPSREQLVYSTLFGGLGGDKGYPVVGLGDGSVVFGGETTSDDLPTTADAFQPKRAGLRDAFVTRLLLDGDLPPNDQLLFSSYLGGELDDVAIAMDLATQGEVSLVGWTASLNFPVSEDAFQKTLNGFGPDGFVATVDVLGDGLLSSTYLGGASFDFLYDVKVGKYGKVTVAASTDSRDFPMTADALDRDYNGDPRDIAVSRLTPNLDSLDYGTFFGGSDWDAPISMDLDGRGNPVLAGLTRSKDLPVTTDAFDRTYNGGERDVLVVSLSLASADSFGTGHPGTIGVPEIGVLGRPVISEDITVRLTSSATQPSPAHIVVGLARAEIDLPFEATLWLVPRILLPLTIPPGPLDIPVTVPSDRSFFGAELFAQLFVLDSGASHEVAASAGLRLLLGG